jgi:hypothetical protein
MRTSLRALRPGLGSVLIVLITWGQLVLLAGCGGHSSTPLAPALETSPEVKSDGSVLASRIYYVAPTQPHNMQVVK